MIKRIIAVFLAVILALSCFSIISSAEENTVLRFGADGKFKIIVFADCQDVASPDSRMISFMGKALDYENPDLVVFTGDNVVVSSESDFRAGAAALLQPVISRNIPYAYTYGNHDAEHLSKQFQYSVYKSLGNCLTYNADDSIYGYGNCNLPILCSDSDDIAFNLWIIDSNMYDGGDYDNVHQDQLDWFLRTDAALEASQGHKVNSLVFQHIALPEIYNCLTEATLGTKSYMGKRYKKQLNSNAHGYLGEFPCPPAVNSGEFDVLKSRGDVLGVVTGHDHSNSFVGTWQGIDFIQMPGMTFHSYGDTKARGYGIIELDERNTSTYTSSTLKYTDRSILDSIPDVYEGVNDKYYRYDAGTYISDIMCSANSSKSTAQNNITSNGYNLIDYDLNSGARGNYIYMGYKTTNDYSQAIKDIRFYSKSSNTSQNTISLPINSVYCTYYRDGTDLNTGSGGDYIYACYSKDNLTGTAITGISFSETANPSNGKVCGTLYKPEVAADLNAGTTTHDRAIYCTTTTNAVEINMTPLKEKYSQFSGFLSSGDFTAESMSVFTQKMNDAKDFLDYMEINRVTDKSIAEIEAFRTSIIDSCASLMKSGTTDGEFIYGVESPTSPEAIKEYFNNQYVNSTVNPTCKYMGTGSTVTLTYDGLTKQYTTVTFGDVNGDGWYDGQDATIVSCLSNGMLSRSDVSKASYIAADCNHDGVIDRFDVEILKDAGILLAEIDQTQSKDRLSTSSVYVEYLNLIDQSPEIEPETESEQHSSFWANVKSFIISIIEAIVNTVKSFSEMLIAK